MPSKVRPWPPEASGERIYALDAAQQIQYIAADARQSVRQVNKDLALEQANDIYVLFCRIGSVMKDASNVDLESDRWPMNALRARRFVENTAKHGKKDARQAIKAIEVLNRELACHILSTIEANAADMEYELKQVV